MTRITKPPYERRKEILDTALELFMKKGYESTSIGDIVEKIGVAQGLFYYYFKSKEEVYRAALEQYTDEFASKLQDIILDSSIPLVKKIEVILKIMDDMFAGSEHAFMEDLHRAEHIEMDYRLSTHVAQLLIEPLTGILENLNEQNKIKLENAEFTATFLIFGIYGLVHGHQDVAHNKEHLKTDEIICLAARVFGITPEKLKEI